MSLNLGVMSAAVTLDDVEYRQKLSGMTGEAESTFKKIAGLAVAYLSGRALWGFANNAMAEFSKLEEGNNKLKYTFTDLRSEAAKTAQQISEIYHLAPQTATNAIADIGDMLTGFGFNQADALNFARQITERGIDVASFKGLDQTDTIQRMTAALTGETDSLKMMGVVIRQDTEDFRNKVLAIQEATGATEAQAKAQAILTQMMEQTKNAAGDYLRPDAPRTYAQEMTDLREAVKTFKMEIGTQLQPIAQDAVVRAREMLEWYNQLDPAFRSTLNSATALAAGFALLAKTGGLAKANIAMSSVNMFSGVKKQAEINLVAATENLKRAEYAKTDAYLEARAAAQSVRIARLAVQEQKAAVATAQIKIANAEKAENIADLAAGKKQLATATQALTKAQHVESHATQQLAVKHALARTANMQHAVAAKACAVANATNAAASTAAGRAQVVLAAGLTKARAAVTAFSAALGPIGWALMALSGVYLGVQYLTTQYRNQLEGEIAASEKAAQAANELAAAHSRARASDNSAMDRLQELSRYEKLNNSEKQEAEKLLKQLTDRYGDLGISIDKVTGKLKISTEALAEMNEQQAREYELDLTRKMQKLTWNIAAEQNGLRNELGTYWTNLLGGAWQLFTLGQGENILGENQNVLDDAMVLETTGKKIAALEKLEAQLTSANERDKASRVGELIKKLKEYQVLEKQQLEFQKTRKLNDPENRNGTSQNISEKTRKAQDSLAELEWDTRFNEADATAKARMLSEKIDGIFKRQSGKYRTLDEFKSADRNAMTEQELKDLQEIVQLEEQRRRLREQSAEAFSDERERYEQMLRDREERRDAQAIEKQLRDARKSGDQAAVDAIMQQQLEKAQRAVRELQRQYEKAVRDAEADGIMTDEERKNLSRIWSDMQREMSDEDRWRREMERAGEEDHSTQRTIGGFSAEVLNAMLGGAGKPVEETAKNTRKMVELLKEKTKREIVELGA